MLENLEKLKLLWYVYSIDFYKDMPSKKVINVSWKISKIPDNQQERLKTIGWIVGYVDGEGCFSVSIFRNKTTKFGWQIFPEFVVAQELKSKKSLESIQKFFGCGKIFINRRHDNHREDLYRYCVRNRKDLTRKIIPFFQKNQLQTAKKKDFKRFSKIVNLMNENVHQRITGIKKIALLIEKMNSRKSSRFLESSETKR
jgi:hypothetical protein